MADEMQDHMNKAMYGAPKVKPDEQRKYLGTFRERVDLTVTFAQLNSNNYYDALEEELTKHPDYRMTINGHVNESQLSKLLQLANKTKVAFTCNTDMSLAHGADDFAIVFADKTQAINHDVIDIAQLYPNATHQVEKATAPKNKKHFSLKDLFHL